MAVAGSVAPLLSGTRGTHRHGLEFDALFNLQFMPHLCSPFAKSVRVRFGRAQARGLTYVTTVNAEEPDEALK